MSSKDRGHALLLFSILEQKEQSKYAATFAVVLKKKEGKRTAQLQR